MAVAVVGTPAETAISTAGTSHVVNLPSGAAGNMFVAVMSKGSAGTTPSVDALTGWNELLDEAIVLGLYIAVKECDGTEGATTTFTLSSATRGAWIVYEVSGQVAFATQAPQVGTTATGSSTLPDPPSVSVTGGTKNILTIACFGRAGEEADDDTWVTSAPSGFGGLLQKACGIVGANLAGMVATADLASQTATSDPATFTIATGAWRAQTIVVHPAALKGAATQALTTTLVTAAKAALKGAATQALSASFTTAGARRVYGAATQALTTTLTTQGQRIGRGASVLPLTLGITSAGDIAGAGATLFGASVLALAANLTSEGHRALLALASADSVDGAWTDQAGGFDLKGAIDEPAYSDADYVRSEFNPANSACRLKLEGLADPNLSTGHILRWRIAKDAVGGKQVDMILTLYEGGGDVLGAGTVIATFSRPNVSETFTTYAEALSAAQADTIADYSALYVELEASAA